MNTNDILVHSNNNLPHMLVVMFFVFLFFSL